ncbi:MAG: hypothetical protein JW819_07845 [Candidatus Krumholzibacteriota bacterium]|nr:hypothetical protein [Candidatus Krumholzibacteriota bacterium]
MTHFYWHTGRDTLCFLTLINKDIVEEGVVAAEERGIVLHGTSHRPDGTVTYRTVLSLDGKGTLTDIFYRVGDGREIRGHVQEYVAGR